MFGRALGHFVQLDFDAGARAGRRLARRTGQAGGAHVLDARHRAGGQQFQAGLADQLFHERIAHLHRPALDLGGFQGQVLGRKGGPGQTVPASRRAHIKDGVAHAAGAAAHDLVVAQDPQAKGIDQRDCPS